MEHIAALLLMVGCSGDLAECRELPTQVPLYEVAADCETERAIELRMAGGDAARVFATCIVVDPALSENDAELTWDVTEEEGLVASIEFYDPSAPLIASHEVDPETTGSIKR